MGDSRGEGERNFWNGKESVTMTKKSLFSNAPNEIELQSLHAEGGSDVFSSNRHVNFNQPSTEFKMNLWTKDDAPVIRPHVMPAQENVNRLVFNHQLDGYGGDGCQRITRLSGRTNPQFFKHVALIMMGGTMVFGALLYLKGGQKNMDKTKQ